MAAPRELAEAAFTGTGLKVEHLVVNLTVPAVKPVRVTLRGGGRSGGALRFYDEDPDNPGYALTSDAGSTSVAKWIPAGDTILTLAAGALRDRVDNGDSVAQSVTVFLSSTDPIYGRARGFEKTVSVNVLDVDESLIAVNKFLATTDPVTSGAITAKAKENAATFVFTAALTSLPFSAVRLEVEGDVDAFESISVDGADGTNRTIEPADWASAATYEFRVADDNVLSGDRNYSVWFVARSDDANYDSVRSATMTCQVIEDDVAFATVSGKTLTVGAGIDGPTFSDGYWITLSAPPTADVVVSLGCADTNVFYTKRLLFTPDDWDRKYVAVNASLADPNVLEGRTATLTHSVASADAFFDGLAVSDVEIAVEFSVDSVPPPKLELVRFLDGGNGLDVLFDSPTNMVDGEWDVDCATLFEYTEQQFGADGTCSWTNSSALRVTFGAGRPDRSVRLRGRDGPQQRVAQGRRAEERPRRRDAHARRPVRRGADAPAPRGAGDLDHGAGERRRLRRRRPRRARRHGRRVPSSDVQWGVLTTWDAETDADMASVASLEAKLQQADAAGAVTLELGFDDLLAGRPYEFLIAATNFLGVTTTAYATVDKLASPSPGVQFQGAATQNMVRSDPKTLKLDVALPNLTCTDMNVSSGAGLRLARVAPRGRRRGDVRDLARGHGGIHREPRVLPPARRHAARGRDLHVPRDRGLRGHDDHQHLRDGDGRRRVSGLDGLDIGRRRAGRGDRRRRRAGRVRVVRPRRQRRRGRDGIRVDRGARAGRREPGGRELVTRFRQRDAAASSRSRRRRPRAGRATLPTNSR